MSSNPRYVVIYNHQSSGAKQVDQLTAWAHEHGSESVDIADIESLTDSELRRFSGLVAGGGDGTVRTVAELAHRTALPLAVVPLGAANDFARSLDIPESIEQATTAVSEAQGTIAIPVAFANNHLFLNAATVGVSVEATHRQRQTAKKTLGSLEYPATVARALLDFEPFSSRIDQEPFHPTIQLNIASGRYYGGGQLTRHDASPLLPTLDLIRVEPFAAADALAVARSFLDGHENPPPCVWTDRVHHVQLDTDPVQEVALDGEIMLTTPLEIHFDDTPLRVLAKPREKNDGLLLGEEQVRINQLYEMLREQTALLTTLQDETPEVEPAIQLRRRLARRLEETADWRLSRGDADRAFLRRTLTKLALRLGVDNPGEQSRQLDRDLRGTIASTLHLPELAPLRKELLAAQRQILAP